MAQVLQEGHRWPLVEVSWGIRKMILRHKPEWKISSQKGRVMDAEEGIAYLRAKEIVSIQGIERGQ